MNCYDIKNLSYMYGDSDTESVLNVSLSVCEGEFVALCGSSGCGKSTLLRCLKPGFCRNGDYKGEILFFGEPLSERHGGRIGFVMQSPEAQLKFDTVGKELEREIDREVLGSAADAVVAEMAYFFGIQTWFDLPVKSLSGGQKQLLNLAAVMAASPDVLILDEPTSQLDPIAAADFIAAVARINRELGTTVIITEHRLDEVLPISSRAVIMDSGRLVACDTPEKVGEQLKNEDHGMFASMPAPMRVYAELSDTAQDCPVSVRDGRLWLEEFVKTHRVNAVSPAERRCGESVAAELKNVWFRYGKDGKDIVKGASFTAKFGAVTAIMGGNGTGKSTTAKILIGENKPYRGKVTVNSENIVYMPQNPLSVLEGEILADVFNNIDKPEEEKAAVIERCDIAGFMDRIPVSLSGGERQRAALAKMLLTDGDIFLFDEPTKGIDGEYKVTFAKILSELADAGKAVIIISHDLGFCAENADKCSMFFDGSIVAEGEPNEFFAGNSFYTTAVSRMARGVIPGSVTVRDVTESFEVE
ncbi:MAG: ATP-binding cassette domain-containing protein [Oscillospiraceae bacterium]|nr:ATP-binding cassette domain-containing protein [Oscillospiraceae bacterium]